MNRHPPIQRLVIILSASDVLVGAFEAAEGLEVAGLHHVVVLGATGFAAPVANHDSAGGITHTSCDMNWTEVNASQDSKRPFEKCC